MFLILVTSPVRGGYHPNVQRVAHTRSSGVHSQGPPRITTNPSGDYGATSDSISFAEDVIGGAQDGILGTLTGGGGDPLSFGMEESRFSILLGFLFSSLPHIRDKRKQDIAQDASTYDAAKPAR